MSNDFLNWDAPEDQLGKIELPYVQWLNARDKALKAVDPVFATGGWELPYDVWSHVFPEREPVMVTHGERKVEVPSFLEPTLSIATIAHRFAWQSYNNNRVEYSKSYTDGATGRIHIFCLIKELLDPDDPKPAMLTMYGNVGKAFNETRNQFRAVLRAATALGGKKYPPYMFWMPVTAGDTTMVGPEKKKSPINPPSPAWELPQYAIKDTKSMKALAAVLSEMYIGDELRDLIAETLFEEGKQWSGEPMGTPQEEQNGNNTAAETNGAPPEPEVPPHVTEDEIPF